MTIAALAVRLPLRDCTADEHRIYMDGHTVCLRPAARTDHEWNALCRYMTGKPAIPLPPGEMPDGYDNLASVRAGEKVSSRIWRSKNEKAKRRGR